MTKRILAVVAAAALLVVLLAGCTPDQPSPVEQTFHQPTGAEVLANYVALGNSLTAGYMDGGLVMNGQVNSFPQLIARQLGLRDFQQPLIAWPGVGSSDTGDPDQVAGVLYFDGAGTAVAGPTPRAEVQNLLLAAAWPVPYNNLGVPGATLADMTNATDSQTSQAPGNAYFDMILRNPTFGNTTELDQGTALGPTLVTLWIGNNDVLGGATSGQPEVGVNITPPSLFETMYTALLDAVTQKVHTRTGFDPVIVVANVPSITTIPYFLPKAVFDAMAGAPIPTVEEDPVYVRLTALSYLAGGGQPPLGAEWTLTQAEVDAVEGAVDAYNQIIADAVAARDNVYLFDAHAAMAVLATQGMDGMTANHFLVLVNQLGDIQAAADATFFSLDGVHPNNRGYGSIANGFIDVINAALGTDVPHVDVASLTWDPTYGQLGGGETTAGLVSPAAGRAIDALFRH